eukprot:2836997-Prymnesium_polylepis.2
MWRPHRSKNTTLYDPQSSRSLHGTPPRPLSPKRATKRATLHGKQRPAAPPETEKTTVRTGVRCQWRFAAPVARWVEHPTVPIKVLRNGFLSRASGGALRDACRLLQQRRSPRPAAAARAAAPVSDATAEAVEAADAAGARAPRAAIQSRRLVATWRSRRRRPSWTCVRRLPGGTPSTRCASPITLGTRPAAQYPALPPIPSTSTHAALAVSYVCDVSRRKVTALKKIVRGAVR